EVVTQASRAGVAVLGQNLFVEECGDHTHHLGAAGVVEPPGSPTGLCVEVLEGLVHTAWIVRVGSHAQHTDRSGKGRKTLQGPGDPVGRRCRVVTGDQGQMGAGQGECGQERGGGVLSHQDDGDSRGGHNFSFRKQGFSKNTVLRSGTAFLLHPTTLYAWLGRCSGSHFLHSSTT